MSAGPLGSNLMRFIANQHPVLLRHYIADKLYLLCLSSLVAGMVFFSSPINASQRLDGCFIAHQSCEARHSIRQQSLSPTNSDTIRLQVFSLYRVLEKNKPAASHYRLHIPGIAPSIQSAKRWVKSRCGEYVANCRLLATDDDNRTGESGMTSGFANNKTNSNTSASTPPVTSTEGSHKTSQAIRQAISQKNLLALSWEPSFCETHQSKPECKSMTTDRHDASHLSLHGLWPQPRSKAYCGVSNTDKSIDRRKKWHLLAALNLSSETAAALAITMPGFASYLQRHEWIKHGTCYGKPADAYYRDSIDLTNAINQSALGTLLAAHIGQHIDTSEIQQAFEDSFGMDTARKISIKCDRGGRFSEIWVNLAGEIKPDVSIYDLVAEADTAQPGNCAGETAFIDAAN